MAGLSLQKQGHDSGGAGCDIKQLLYQLGKDCMPLEHVSRGGVPVAGAAVDVLTARLPYNRFLLSTSVAVCR